MRVCGINNRQSSIVNRQLSAGFTLIELLIVVAILGIISAIVLPEFQGHAQEAKEAAAKDNLRILRETIERYAADHNDVAPGYQNNNPAGIANFIFVKSQLVTGSTKYLSELPKNPFNGLSQIKALGNSTPFPDTAQLTTMIGWYYKPATKTIRLNWTGTDSEGKAYFDY